MLRSVKPITRYICRNLWNSISVRKQHYLSRIYSRLYSLSISRYLVAPYCRIHGLGESYLAHYTPSTGSPDYDTFQSFFSRRLRAPPKVVGETCWPCDGTLCESRPLGELHYAHVKGILIDGSRIFDLNTGAIPGDYAFVNIFLHNKDYHRIHAPVSGVIRSISRIPGELTVLRPWINGSNPSAPAFINERLSIRITDRRDRPWFLAAVGGPAVGTIQIARGLMVGASVTIADELASFSLGSTCCLAAPVYPCPLPVGSEIKVGSRFE
jgi:phosphatidylserine decarboxylase